MSIFSWLFKRSFEKRGRLTDWDRDQARTRWAGVEEQIRLGKPSNMQVAVMDSDKIIDDLLKVLYPATQTMGERLKLARDQFREYKTYDELWQAHKTRNAMVHEASFELPNFEAIAVLGKYRNALREFGV